MKYNLISIAALSLALTACGPEPVHYQQAQPQVVQQPAPVVVQQHSGPSAGETALAAGAGAAMGAMVGNALSNRSQPQYHDRRPVIVQKNVTIINKTKNYNQPSAVPSQPKLSVTKPSDKSWFKGYKKK